MMLAMVGGLHGEKGGGDYFDDSEACSLTFNEQLIEITGHGTKNELNYIQFHYSNNKSKQHGQKPLGSSMSRDYKLKLKPGEYINGVTIYTGIRKIPNQYKPDGTLIVVGLRFHMNQGGPSQLLFGSDDGDEIKEDFPNYKLGYIRGRAYGYLDAIQFIWYRETVRTASATLP
jgi:hypothetical protein